MESGFDSLEKGHCPQPAAWVREAASAGREECRARGRAEPGSFGGRKSRPPRGWPRLLATGPASLPRDGPLEGTVPDRWSR